MREATRFVRAKMTRGEGMDVQMGGTTAEMAAMLCALVELYTDCASKEAKTAEEVRGIRGTLAEIIRPARDILNDREAALEG